MTIVKDNLKAIIFIGLIVLASSFFAAPIFASNDVQIEDVQILDMIDNTAHIKWTTPGYQTKGIVYYGYSEDKLDFSVGYGSYDFTHTVALTGLKVDTDYYYRILAIDQADDVYESYIQIFSTEDMEDTRRPEFVTQEIIQIRGDSIAIYWEQQKLLARTISPMNIIAFKLSFTIVIILFTPLIYHIYSKKSTLNI